MEALIALLREENTQQNLVAAQSLEHVWQRHIIDSAQLLLHVPRETVTSWIDLGSGAGFPGVVIAALQPNLTVHLVESRARRIDWLGRLADHLSLENIQVVGSRLETVDTAKFDAISARAFAPLDSLVARTARFSTADTIWLLPKGRSAAHELQELTGWRHLFHVEQSITDQDAGIIVGTLIGPAKPEMKGKRA